MVKSLILFRSADGGKQVFVRGLQRIEVVGEERFGEVGESDCFKSFDLHPLDKVERTDETGQQ